MAASQTPGKLYVVRQLTKKDDFAWQVIDVDEAQGQQMMDRNEPYVYKTSTQAYAVRDNLNRVRLERKLGKRSDEPVCLTCMETLSADGLCACAQGNVMLSLLGDR